MNEAVRGMKLPDRASTRPLLVKPLLNDDQTTKRR
jgi:hypothetical protein